MKEIWKDVFWYEWYYKISNTWKIKSLVVINKYWVFKKERILKPRIHTNYLYVQLCKDWEHKEQAVHRLVAQGFLWLDINNSNIHVLHKDDNPNNNYINNLFLGDQLSNMQDMSKKGRSAHQWKLWKLNHNSKKIWRYNLDWELIDIWHWTWEVIRELNIDYNRGNIIRCCTWKAKTAYWFIWKYKNND